MILRATGKVKSIVTKRSLTVWLLALTFLVTLVLSSQGTMASRAGAYSGDSISVKVQALSIDNPMNDPYKWPPPTVKEIKLDDGKVLKLGVWGFIIRAPGLTEEKGDFWIAGWKFLAEQIEVPRDSSAKARFSLTFLSFSTPESLSVGLPIGGTLPPLTYDMYGGFYETAGAKIGVSITWAPANKPIVVSTYCDETGRGQGIQITGGSWAGLLTVIDTGINYVVVANPNSDATLTYSGQVLFP